ncbi:MAG: carboxypeptidase-like regulatory domain-containing protein [Lewinella sp.]|nr:carboxypeptidase-like regulatory domain-containing protein [Lewinella sp.]
MKKLSLVLALVVFACGFAIAQRTISGTITDTGGEPLIGASILVKGTTSGTVTDIDGKYTLSVPDGSTTLVVSYTGFSTQEVEIGAQSVVDIAMAESAEVLSEVVVTGLGIKKEKKALGYGVTTLDQTDIANRVESDVARILRGKATGVDITQTSGLAGSGTNVIIRGYSSITGTNQPLFVIDGIPFNTETNSIGGFTNGSAASSSRFLDLDPNNIAEVSILKGLSATVLYGEAGRNGVILITTKNRAAADNSSDKKFEVSVTQQLASSQVANLPDYQNTYGNGFSGDFGWFFSNWGPSFDTRGSNGIAEDGTIDHPYDQSQYNDAFPEYIGVRYPYQPYESVENFFSPGLTSNTSISIQNNLGNGSSISATYSYLSDEGFLPKLDEMRGGGPSNYLNKHNFGLGGSTQLANGLKLNATFNYADSESRLLPTAPGFGGDGNGFYAALVFTPRSIDLMNLPYQSPLDGSNVYYRRGSAIQNPRWTLNNSSFNERVRRFFSTIEMSYELTPWLNALYRLGLDQYTQNSEEAVNRGGPRNPDGQL